MNAWLWLSTLFAVGVSGLSVYALTQHFDRFKPIERYGLGIMAGCALLTIPPRMIESPTPYDDWAGTLLWLGILLFLSGKAVRLVRHDRRNEKQALIGEQWLKDRGKWP